jgi:hypothetical protein
VPRDKIFHEFKEGTLHSGSKSGPKVTNRKQAVAIALSYPKEGEKKAHGGKVFSAIGRCSGGKV